LEPLQTFAAPTLGIRTLLALPRGMKHHAAFASRVTTVTLALSMGLVGLSLPAPASAQTPPASVQTPPSTAEAAKTAKVAKKVEKARRAGERAEREATEALKHFQKEVAEYERLHVAQLARLGTMEPARVQEALARAIVAKRDGAKPGDIFEKDVQPLFRALTVEQLKGPDTAAAQKAVVEGNPTRDEDSAPVLVRVNAAYPAGASRSTVPASLLLALPPLPACLHYRFVERDLLLVDSVAQIIVDFLPAAAPALVGK